MVSDQFIFWILLKHLALPSSHCGLLILNRQSRYQIAPIWESWLFSVISQNSLNQLLSSTFLRSFELSGPRLHQAMHWLQLLPNWFLILLYLLQIVGVLGSALQILCLIHFLQPLVNRFVSFTSRIFDGPVDLCFFFLVSWFEVIPWLSISVERGIHLHLE